MPRADWGPGEALGNHSPGLWAWNGVGRVSPHQGLQRDRLVSVESLSLTLDAGPTGQPCEWHSIDGSIVLPVASGSPKALALEHALCLTGDGLAYLQATNPQQLLHLIPHVQVFARVAPKQKVRAGPWRREGWGWAHRPAQPVSAPPCRSSSSPA